MTEEDLTIHVSHNRNTHSGLAHLMLAGTATKAISYVSAREQPFAFTAACALFGYGLYGTFVKTHTSLKWYPKLKNAYNWLRLGVKSFSLPLMNSYLGQLIGEGNHYVYCHLASGLAPLVYGLGRQYDNSLTHRTERILGLVILGNACSLVYIGTIYESPVVLSLAFWQLLIQNFPVLVKEKIDTKHYDIETFGMSVYALILVLMFKNIQNPMLMGALVE